MTLWSCESMIQHQARIFVNFYFEKVTVLSLRDLFETIPTSINVATFQHCQFDFTSAIFVSFMKAFSLFSIKIFDKICRVRFIGGISTWPLWKHKFNQTRAFKCMNCYYFIIIFNLNLRFIVFIIHLKIYLYLLKLIFNYFFQIYLQLGS